MKGMIVRKFMSAVFTAVILSYLFVLIDGHSSFIVYFTIFCAGYLIVGVPCSIVAELVNAKIKGNILGLVIGGIIHLIFAGIVIFWLSFDDPGGFSSLMNHAEGIVYAVIMAAIGLWLTDILFKHLLRDELSHLA